MQVVAMVANEVVKKEDVSDDLTAAKMGLEMDGKVVFEWVVWMVD